MSNTELPLIIDPSQLQSVIGEPNILLVDMGKPETYIQSHIPGAVFLDYAWIVRVDPPRMGLLPLQQQLDSVFSALGLSQHTHIIAYDDEGGGRACRLLWTLEAIGHQHYSLLDGGIQAWTNSGQQVSNTVLYPTPAEYHATINEQPVAQRPFILQHLNDPEVVILDTRSMPEYSGQKVFAQRGGHIPGAVHWEWTEAMDKSRDLRLKPAQQLLSTLENMAVTKDKLIITHCQTHHRSAHTYIVLKSLGYENIKGYPGSWSDWGNAEDTPIE